MIFLTFFDNMDKMPFTIWLRDVIHIISQLVCSPGHDMRAVCVPETTRLDLWWRWSLTRVAALLARTTEPVNADWTRRCILGHESGGAGLEGFAGPVPVRVL